MKNNELTGAQLDYWVARALGAKQVPGTSAAGGACWFLPDDTYVDPLTTQRTFAPSMYWAQGGPLLDRLIASGAWRIEPWSDSDGIAPGCTVMITNYHYVGPDYMREYVPIKEGSTAPIMEFITPTLLQAVCQATVASVYGPNVPDGAP